VCSTGPAGPAQKTEGPGAYTPRPPRTRMAGSTGFEPAVSALTGRRVGPSYTTTPKFICFFLFALMVSGLAPFNHFLGSLASVPGRRPFLLFK
jgi:hypothetical protein